MQPPIILGLILFIGFLTILRERLTISYSLYYTFLQTYIVYIVYRKDWTVHIWINNWMDTRVKSRKTSHNYKGELNIGPVLLGIKWKRIESTAHTVWPIRYGSVRRHGISGMIMKPNLYCKDFLEIADNLEINYNFHFGLCNNGFLFWTFSDFDKPGETKRCNTFL